MKILTHRHIHIYVFYGVVEVASVDEAVFVSSVEGVEVEVSVGGVEVETSVESVEVEVSVDGVDVEVSDDEVVVLVSLVSPPVSLDEFPELFDDVLFELLFWFPVGNVPQAPRTLCIMPLLMNIQ